MKIASQVLFHSRSSPERPALAFSGGVVTYGMVGRGVTTACSHIRKECLTPRGVVAIDVRNPLQHVALILALEMCGLTSLSITTRHDLDESGLRVDAILTDGIVVPHPTARSIKVDDGWFRLAEKVEAEPVGVAEDQYARIILSSGTTGRPKAVGYKPDLIGRFMQRQCLMRAESTPRNLSMIGLSTLGVLNPLFALAQGGFACFASSNEEVLWMIRSYQITRLGFTTAAQLEALVVTAKKSADTCPSLQVIHVSGSRLPAEVAAEARARLCGNIILSYASTEMGIVSYARVGAPDEPAGSAGYVLPWVDIDVRDELGRQLPNGAQGHLHVRSPDIADYVDPNDRIPLDAEGWFATGDIGSLREDRLLVVDGRATDVINAGGNIVAPEYVEAVLAAQAGIREAGVFARTNDAGIDEIWGAVVTQGMISRDMVLDACRRLLGDKAPKRLEIVDALPRTPNGKLQRHALRERFQHR